MGVLKAENFYSEVNQQVYGFMTEMFEQNRPISLESAVDYICRVKGITLLSGKTVGYFLVNLTTKVDSTANLEYYSILIKQMWIDREVILITSSGMKGKNSKEEILNLQERLMALNSINFKSDWKDMGELMVDLFKHQDEMARTKGMGIHTGFGTIDHNYGGFFPGQMIVIGARPSVGKSAFAGGIAMNMAGRGKKVGFISLEMNNNEIAARFAAQDTNISFRHIYRNLFEDEKQRGSFHTMISRTANLPIKVIDKTDLNMLEIRADAHRLKHDWGLDCLIIDYLQLVAGNTKQNRSRENEVAQISRDAKILAKDLEVPLIVLCQLNREVDKRKGADRYPHLSDFRESGAIEQDADVAMFLHSDYKSGFIVDENGNSTENEADIVIRKWRNGDANKIIPLHFDGPKMKFSERGTEVRNFSPVNYYEKEEEPF